MLKKPFILVGLTALVVALLVGLDTVLASRPPVHMFQDSVVAGSGGHHASRAGYGESESAIQSSLASSGTFAIQSYPPLGTMVVTTTQRFAGSFPPNPFFYTCANASGLVFGSTGGTCSWNASAQRIYCPTGITSFNYSYACPLLPALTGSRLTVRFTSDWTGGTIDRTWQFAHTPLTYHSATIQPDLSTGHLIRWTQIDSPSISIDVSFIDPRVTHQFLPLARK